MADDAIERLRALSEKKEDKPELDAISKLRALSNNSQEQTQEPEETAQQGYTPYATVEQDVDWHDLHMKDDWIRASQHFFEMTYGYVPQKGDKELEGYEGSSYREKLADYGLQQMAGFNYNIGDMTIDSARVLKADQQTKEAFIYMLDQYDATNSSWHTFGDAAWESVTDVTNLIGLATLGGTAVAGQAAKLAMKTATRETIKASLKKATASTVNAASKVGLNSARKRTAALAGFETAAHAMASDNMMQDVRIDAGAQEEYDVSRTLIMGSFGLVGGAAVGTALDMGVSKIASKYYEPKIAAEKIKQEKAAVQKQIIAEKKLADAKAEAETLITRAVDDDLTPAEIDKLVKDQVDRANAEESGYETVAFIAPKLPTGLRGAQPRYNYGDQSIDLIFGDDVARTLYQMGSKNKSKYYKEYRKFLEDAGVKDIDGQAAQIRANIKAKARFGDTEVEVTYNKPKTMRKKVVKKEEPKVKDTSDPRPPKARISPNMFVHAHTIFSEMKRDPQDSLNRFLNDFETERHNPKEYSEVLDQINGANELAGYDVEVIEGLLTKNITDQERTILQNDLVKAYDVVNATDQLAKHANAYSGRNLNEIKQFQTYRQNLAAEKGEDFNYEAMVDDAHEKVLNRKLQRILDKYEAKINEAHALPEGGFDKANELRLQRDKDPEFNETIEKLEAMHLKRTAGVKPESTGWDKFLEASISGVFSPSTFIFNTVFPAMKVAFYPMLDTIITDPLNRMAWKKNLRIYAQMKGAVAAAWKSARASSDFEQTFLTRDTARFLDGGVKIDTIFGSAVAAKHLRTFPRLVAASDAFNQEIAAVAALTADGMDRLVDEGLKKGLKGKKLEKYIDDNIEAEINKGYDFSITEAKLKPIYEAGTRKGLKGEKLNAYVKEKVDKYGEGAFKTLNDTVTVKELRDNANNLLKEGTPEGKQLAEQMIKEADKIAKLGEEALDAVQTLLYKRDFNKDGNIAEKAAAGYENWTRHRAWSKVMGNYFFRTPAWLFHESLRLTPAVNQLLPQFRNDLAGVNGASRQARARTEAGFAYAWMLYVMSKYAEGSIAGSPNKDYTMTGEKNKSTMRPLTIKDPFFFEGGKEVSFARWEPLRIPTTIVVNALDGYMDFQEQSNLDAISGVSTPEGYLPDEVKAAIGVGFATALSAIRDSALTQGVTDTVGTVTRAAGLMESPDGEDKEKAWDLAWGLVAKKGLAVVPSTFRKTQEAFFGDAPLTQPKTITEKVIATIDPYNANLPLRFDALGFPMSREVSYAQITGFGAALPEDLAQGRSPEHMEVLDYLAKLEELRFGNFTRQKTRDDRFPNQDLRMIKVDYDGKEMPLFNAMMFEMAKDDFLIQDLLYYARGSKQELGSPLNSYTHGERVTETKRILNEARNTALDNVIEQDPRLAGLVENKAEYEFRLQQGDSTNRGNNPLTGE